MRKVNIHDAKTHLSAILTEVENGERVLICRYNVPIAELSPVAKRNRTQPDEVLRNVVFIDAPELSTETEWDHALYFKRY